MAGTAVVLVGFMLLVVKGDRTDIGLGLVLDHGNQQGGVGLTALEARHVLHFLDFGLIFGRMTTSTPCRTGVFFLGSKILMTGHTLGVSSLVKGADSQVRRLHCRLFKMTATTVLFLALDFNHFLEGLIILVVTGATFFVAAIGFHVAVMQGFVHGNGFPITGKRLDRMTGTALTVQRSGLLPACNHFLVATNACGMVNSLDLFGIVVSEPFELDRQFSFGILLMTARTVLALLGQSIGVLVMIKGHHGQFNLSECNERIDGHNISTSLRCGFRLGIKPLCFKTDNRCRSEHEKNSSPK